MSSFRLLACWCLLLAGATSAAAQVRPAPGRSPLSPAPPRGQAAPAQAAAAVPPKPVPVERLEQRGSARWHVLRQDEREYVRFDDIKSFYDFDTMDIIGDEVVLESVAPPLSLRFLAGMRQAQFESYKCFLSFPPVQYRNRIYLSRIDLALLLDPIIRPPRMDLTEGEKLGILIEVVPKDALAVEVAQHLKAGLDAFGMHVITSLSESTPDEAILGGIRLLEHDESEELQTLTLAPHGAPIHGKKTVPAQASRERGNDQDRLNIAMGLALHANLMKNVEGVLDGGLARDRMSFLREATRPAVAIRLPSATTASPEVIGAAMVRGLRKFRDTVSRQFSP